MSQLSHLISTAVMGTQREALPDFAAGTPIADLISGLSEAAPESVLLSAAGAIRLGELAGQLPSHAPAWSSAFVPPADDVPPCGEQAGQRLAAMLNGRFQAALLEFLIALTQAGLRAPDELLPALLEYGLKTAPQPELILALGKTGRWLAAQNPAWDYASPDTARWDALADLWRSGSADLRSALMFQLRATRPDWGLALLQLIWKTEPGLARNRLFRLLERGTSAADEPFLEAALDDRDRSTRRIAGDLLAQIPDSRLVQRMTEYAPDLLRWSGKKNFPIKIIFPDPIPASMIRDGVPAIAPTASSNLKRMQMKTILGAIPLTVWESMWQASPEQIVYAALASTWPRTLIQGFALAAARQRNTTWAHALLIGDSYSGDVIRLASVLTQTDMDALIAQSAKSDHPLEGGVMARLLYHRGGAWSESVAQRWLDALAAHLTQPAMIKPPVMNLRMVIKSFGRNAPAHLADHAAAALLPAIQPDSVWWAVIQEAVAMLYFRQGMLAEIDQ